MSLKTFNMAIAIALFGSLVLVGCKKKQDETAVSPPPAATEAPPTPTTAPVEPTATAPAATVSVTSVDLGNTVGPDMKVTTPTTTFAKTDKIIAAVSTSSSEPTTTASGKLGAKWTFQDGQVVSDDTKDFSFTGTDVTNFEISKSDGLPTGKYKVEISIDGKVVQSKDFEVK